MSNFTVQDITVNESVNQANIVISSETTPLPPVLIVLPVVSTVQLQEQGGSSLSFHGNLEFYGSTTVIETGFQYNTVPGSMVLDASSASTPPYNIGDFYVSYTPVSDGFYYARAYAINDTGISYGEIYTVVYEYAPCLAKGTMITLVNGNQKPIEDVQYSDFIKVWNFDEGKFDVSTPLWIKVAQNTNKYNLYKFSDNSELKTIEDHRIFDADNSRFSHPTLHKLPIGTKTFNVKGQQVELLSKEVIHEPVEYYNIATNIHINLFANGILTSSRFNNIYRIENMKYVKEDRQLVSRNNYPGISDEDFEGYRLSEQPLDIEDTKKHLARLNALKK